LITPIAVTRGNLWCTLDTGPLSPLNRPSTNGCADVIPKREDDFSGIVRKTPPPKDDAGGRSFVKGQVGGPAEEPIAEIDLSRCVIAYRQAHSPAYQRGLGLRNAGREVVAFTAGGSCPCLLRAGGRSCWGSGCGCGWGRLGPDCFHERFKDDGEFFVRHQPGEPRQRHGHGPEPIRGADAGNRSASLAEQSCARQLTSQPAAQPVCRPVWPGFSWPLTAF
jgi:hypothetical protein